MDEIIWQSINIPEQGKATTFPLYIGDRAAEGFAVGFDGTCHAYLNSCPHNGSPLDWVPGRFFSEDGSLLVCQTHGALFSPDSGACLSGPCPHGLIRLPLRESEGNLQVPSRMDAMDI